MLYLNIAIKTLREQLQMLLPLVVRHESVGNKALSDAFQSDAFFSPFWDQENEAMAAIPSLQVNTWT